MMIITNIANGPQLPLILMIKDVYDDDHSGDYHHGDEEKIIFLPVMITMTLIFKMTVTVMETMKMPKNG